MSEEALKALERADGHLVDLLTTAATIIHLDLSIPLSFSHTEPLSPSKSFREAWVLRWLLRRLEALSKGTLAKSELQSSDVTVRFVKDCRLYRLIAHLLSALPRKQALEILNERKYLNALNGVFGACLAVTGQHASTLKGGADLQIQSSNPDRESKRRKLSDDGTFSTDRQATFSVLDTLLAVLQTTQRLSALFLTTSPKSSGSTAFLARERPRLNPDELGDLTGKILCASTLVLHFSEAGWRGTAGPSTDVEVLVSNNVSSWLDLWHNHASGSTDKVSEVQHNTWNQHCLFPALSLLQSPLPKDVVKSLEVEVALHTAVPLEAKFEKLFSAKWRRHRQQLKWVDIRPTFEMLAQNLPVLFDREVVQEQCLTQNHVATISQLFDIMVRLVPRSDIKKRAARKPWLEAFAICLIYTGYPHLIPEFINRKGEVMTKTSWTAIAQAAENPKPLLKLIETARHHDIDLSIAAWQHVYLLTANDQHLKGNAELLAALTKSSPQIFLPSTESDAPYAFIDVLKGQLSTVDTCSEEVLEFLLSQVLVPIMQEYARARCLDQWLQIWQTALVDTFFARSNDHDRKLLHDAALVWDNEGIFQHFEIECRMHTPLGFGQSFLEELKAELQGLPSLRGSSHGIMSKVAIAVALLKARLSRGHTRSEDIEMLSAIGEASAKALQRKTDYQGQRWRLWDLLSAVYNLLPHESHLLDVYDLSTALLSASNPWIASDGSARNNAQLLEIYHAFLFVADRYEFNPEVSTIFETLLAKIDAAIQVVLSSVNQQISHTWDGSNLGLDSTQKLLIACVGRFVRPRILSRVAVVKVGEELLTHLMCLAMFPSTEPGVIVPRKESLSSIATAMVQTISNLMVLDVTDICLSILQNYSSLVCSSKILAVLQRQIARGTSKTKVQKVIKALAAADLHDAEESAQAKLQLRETILAQYPGMAKDVKNLTSGKVLEDSNDTEPLPEISEEISAGHLHLRLDSFAMSMQNRDQEDLLQELEAAASASIETKISSAERRGSLIRACVLVSALPTAKFENNPVLASNLAELASLSRVPTTDDPLELLANLTFGNVVLTNHPALINQHNIDTLLASLTILTSSSSPILINEGSPIHPTAVFTYILNLVLTVVRVHRRRITTRHHLITPLLQRLLSTLFYPSSRQYLHQSSAKAIVHHASFLATLPPWLNPRTRTSHETLSSDCARQFSRLLQALCDPSPSAAKHALRRPSKPQADTNGASKNFDLSDPTKILKRQTSSYLQPVLITYTQCVLDGYLSPEIREKLMPGLYAVMNAMDKDVMSAMSVGMMTDAQRDIWRGVWEDWGKYGRWKGK